MGLRMNKSWLKLDGRILGRMDHRFRIERVLSSGPTHVNSIQLELGRILLKCTLMAWSMQHQGSEVLTLLKGKEYMGTVPGYAGRRVVSEVGNGHQQLGVVALSGSQPSKFSEPEDQRFSSSNHGQKLVAFRIQQEIWAWGKYFSWICLQKKIILFRKLMRSAKSRVQGRFLKASSFVQSGKNTGFQS